VLKMIKRLALLAAVAAAALTTGGCAFGEWLTHMHACSRGVTEACSYDGPYYGEYAKASRAAAQAGQGPKRRFRARFTNRKTTMSPAIIRQGGGSIASNVLVKGRFRGSLLGGSKAGRQFRRGRWISRGDLRYDSTARIYGGAAYVLLRFEKRGAGSLCLSVRFTVKRLKKGRFRERGRFVALGGTGAGAELVGTGRFTQTTGRRGGRMRGRSRLTTGAARPEPALCTALRSIH
jgi:hypothetical protein